MSIRIVFTFRSIFIGIKLIQCLNTNEYQCCTILLAKHFPFDYTSDIAERNFLFTHTHNILQNFNLFPAQLPDLNIIESLWVVLKGKVENRFSFPTSPSQASSSISWKMFSQNDITLHWLFKRCSITGGVKLSIKSQSRAIKYVAYFPGVLPNPLYVLTITWGITSAS